MNDLSGQSLGRYHLIERQGEGGMAVVYKAFDTRLECDVAVKVIRMEELPQSGIQSALKRFEREAKAVAQLNHPNIVNVTDYGEQNGLPYLVMQYLPGGTLKQYLGKPMPFSEAAQLLIPMARALQYAHSHNVVHRDVKPSNILITESGEPMLTDFGIAKILDLQEGQTLTGTGVGIGTPEYMAPEQWTGNITPAVDIYSLGVVFYELVTGHKPYTADTPAAVLLKQATEPLPRPSKFVTDLPENVEQVIFKALAKKPESRYSSMNEFGVALKGLEGEAVLPHAATIPHKPVMKREEPADSGNLETSQIPNDVVIEISNPPNKTKEKGKAKKTPLIRAAEILALLVGIFFIIWTFGGRFITHRNFAEQPTPFNTPGLNIGSTQISPIDNMIMVYVPAGDFIMGLPYGEGLDDDYPQHTVFLDAYWIDQTPVTNEMYAKCVAAGVCTLPSTVSSFSHSTYYGDSSFNDFPVIHVDWYQAQSYCHWAGRSLPTEAQWEKAARGTEGFTYPWGNSDLNASLLNYNLNIEDTTQVGSYSAGASPYGALDMLGNVLEWVADRYKADYYIQSPGANPEGPETGEYRVARGGSWSSLDYIRTTFRDKYTPFTSGADIGFRCAMPAN